MVLVIPENQVALVVKLQEAQEEANYCDLEATLGDDLPLVVEEDLDDGDEVAGQRFGNQDGLTVVVEHSVEYQIDDPDEVVLADEDRQQ